MNNGSTIISNVIWKFAERILAQLVTLVVSIVLARLLLPNDFGAISMVLVFINIANIFVIEGIPSALIQKKNADQLDFSSVFLFNAVFSLLVYAVLFFSAPYIAAFYNYPLLSPVFRVLGLRILVAAVNSVQHAYVSRHMMFRKYFWSTLFGTLLSGIVGVIMAYMGFGVWSLVAQYMVNTTVDTIVLFYTVDWRPTLQFDFSRVKQLFSFGWKMLFEAVSNTVAGQIRNLIIGKVYTPSDLAFYTKAQQFPSLVMTNISASIASVLFPAIANEQTDKQRVLQILRKSVRVSSYVAYPMLVGLALVATPFIRLLLTEKWIETVPYLQIFCFFNMPAIGMIPRHEALLGTGRSDVFMNEHIAARLIGLVILFLTYRISIWAIIWGGTISTVIMTAVIAYTSKKYSGYGYRDQVRDLIPILLGCAVMGVPVYCLNFLSLPDIIKLTLQVALGIIVYVLYSMVFKMEEFYVCKGFVFSVMQRLHPLKMQGAPKIQETSMQKAGKKS